MVIVGYFIDFPIGILVEIVRPYLGESSSGTFILISMYVFLGGLYWFLIFVIIAKIWKVMKRKKSHNE